MQPHLGDVRGEALLPARSVILRDGHCVVQRVALILAVVLACSIGVVTLGVLIVVISFL